MIDIKGEIIDLKSATLDDAEFILFLRTDKELNKFISSTLPSIESQRNWIREYLIREKKREEFYFIVKDKRNNSCGTVRLYQIDIERKECTWGSFILKKNRPDGSSFETIHLSLDYAFNTLNLKKIFLDVRKENKKAIYIYEKFGFEKINEDKENYYYIIER